LLLYYKVCPVGTAHRSKPRQGERQQVPTRAGKPPNRVAFSVLSHFRGYFGLFCGIPLIKTSIFTIKLSVFSNSEGLFAGVLFAFLYSNKEQQKGISEEI